MEALLAGDTITGESTGNKYNRATRDFIKKVFKTDTRRDLLLQIHTQLWNNIEHFKVELIHQITDNIIQYYKWTGDEPERFLLDEDHFCYLLHRDLFTEEEEVERPYGWERFIYGVVYHTQTRTRNEEQQQDYNEIAASIDRDAVYYCYQALFTKYLPVLTL